MISRKLIKKSREKSKRFFMNLKKKGKYSSLHKHTAFILRTKDFSIDYELTSQLLDNIQFIYDPINKHWAETDGSCIFLNTYKNFKNDKNNILTNTLIHEALHNIILRNNKFLIPEEKEHKIMELMNPLLISHKYLFYNS